MQLLKNIENYMSTDKNNSDEKDIMSDIRYICKSCSLITESLQKGCDVMQMPNGDIIVTEVKTFTFQYTWDDKKGKLVRVQSGGRLKKNKSSGKTRYDADNHSEDSYEEDQIDQMA
ncbi:MAG: DUF2671 domain-containing protein [Alphaproteobacteria bacterium]